MRLPPTALLLTVSVAGCSHIDAALKARIDRQLAEHATVSPRLLPAADASRAVPWAKGQYALLALTADGETSLIKLAITAQDEHQVALAYTRLSQQVRDESDLVFKRQPRSAAEAEQALELLVAYRGDEPPITYRFEGDSAAMNLMRAQLRGVWQSFLPNLPVESPPRRQLSTRAGTFEDCVPWAGHLKLRGGLDTDFQGWAHPGVPLAPLVQATSLDGKTTLELIDYGFEGGGPDL